MPQARNTGRKGTAEAIPNMEFHGPSYSMQELEFLHDHLGEMPEIAVPDLDELPDGVNYAAIEPVLSIVHKLTAIQAQVTEKYGQEQGVRVWRGIDAVKDIIRKTIEWNLEKQDLKERSAGSAPEIRRAAGAPTLHLWDRDTDIPYLGGVGADADIERTALGPGMTRIPLYIALRDTGIGKLTSLSGVAKFLKHASPEAQQKSMQSAPNKLEHKDGDVVSQVICPVCGHAETWETAKSHQKRQAEARVMKHLQTARARKSQHDLLYKRLVSGRAGRGSEPADAEQPETVEA